MGVVFEIQCYVSGLEVDKSRGVRDAKGDTEL